MSIPVFGEVEGERIVIGEGEVEHDSQGNTRVNVRITHNRVAEQLTLNSGDFPVGLHMCPLHFMKTRVI